MDQTLAEGMILLDTAEVRLTCKEFSRQEAHSVLCYGLIIEFLRGQLDVSAIRVEAEQISVSHRDKDNPGIKGEVVPFDFVDKTTTGGLHELILDSAGQVYNSPRFLADHVKLEALILFPPLIESNDNAQVLWTSLDERIFYELTLILSLMQGST